MALYNDIVMDNFLNPKNVGELENPDGTGVYGSPVCGDMMQIQIKVDENDKITDAKFKTFGCGSAIYDYAQKTGKHYAALEGYDPEADEDDEHGEEE